MPEPAVELAAIVTTPPDIRFARSPEPMIISSHFDYSIIGEQKRVPVLRLSEPPSAHDYLDIINGVDGDIVLALGWYYLIPPKVLTAVPKGCLGIHGSLLPKYRGMSPVTWVLINGERETGVSLFYLEKGVDTGDIVAQHRTAIDDNDTCASLYDKVTSESVAVLKEFLPRLADGTAPRIKQDHSQATVFGRRSEKDGRLDWTKSAREIYNFVRAQTRPYPGAFAFLKDQKLRVWAARPLEDSSVAAEPGTLLNLDGSVTVATGKGVLLLTDYEVVSPVSGDLRPMKLVVGDRLT